MDDFERSDKGVHVAVIEPDVVAGTGPAIEPQPGADGKGDGLGLANGLGRGSSAV